MNAQAYEATVNAGPVPVIPRKDAAGNSVIFIQSELDMSKDGGEIAVWHSGTDTRKVPLSYYHSSTKLEHDKELETLNRFAADFKPTFGVAVKRRLSKDLSKHATALQNNEMPKSANSTLRRATDKPNPPVFSQEEYRAKMQIAIQAAIAAVDAEYNNK